MYDDRIIGFISFLINNRLSLFPVPQFMLLYLFCILFHVFENSISIRKIIYIHANQTMTSGGDR